MDKCFCHIVTPDGTVYIVKDKEARELIDLLSARLEIVERATENIDEIKNAAINAEAIANNAAADVDDLKNEVYDNTVRQIENDNDSYAAVYTRLKNNGSHRLTPMSAAASGAAPLAGYLVLRAADGQLIGPNQETYAPTNDQYITKRYFDNHKGNGGAGAKLYKHTITMDDYLGGYWCYKVIFSFYSYTATPFTDLDMLPIPNGSMIAAGGIYDANDDGMDVSTIYAIEYKVNTIGFLNTSHGSYADGSAGWEFDIEITAGEGEDYHFTDTVTEVI